MNDYQRGVIYGLRAVAKGLEDNSKETGNTLCNTEEVELWIYRAAERWEREWKK